MDDPEWPGRKDLELAWRFPEAYLSAQFKYGSVFYGQMERNWGPVGLPGIGVSNYGYPQVEAGFLVGTRTLQLEALARSLDGRAGLAAARTVHRYFFAHRRRRPVERPVARSGSGRRRCSRASTASSTAATAIR